MIYATQVFSTFFGAYHGIGAKALDIPAEKLQQCIKGKIRINAGRAVRLAHAFDTPYELWLFLQQMRD